MQSRSTKSADLIGHSKFLLWQQFDGCSVIRPFISATGVACKTKRALGLLCWTAGPLLIKVDPTNIVKTYSGNLQGVVTYALPVEAFATKINKKWGCLITMHKLNTNYISRTTWRERYVHTVVSRYNHANFFLNFSLGVSPNYHPGTKFLT